MAVMKNPLDPRKRISFQEYDRDTIVENSLSEKHEFRDMPRVSQLTQNSWNLSPYTRQSNYNDLHVSDARPMPRREIIKPKIRVDRYRDPIAPLMR
jgi:hypothetical protein